MKEMQFTVERGGPLLPFLLEHVKGAATMSSRCSPGDRCRWTGRPSAATTTPSPPAQRVSVLAQGAEARRAPFPVLYEDGRILVIDKPSGLLSMASDREKVRTAYRMAGEYVRRTRPGGRVFIVHRLDRDTSGVLLFAKDEEAKRAYQEHWDALVRRRGYLAVVEGRPPKGGGHHPHPSAGERRPQGVLRPLRRQGGGDPLPHHPGGAGVHPAGGGHRHRAQEPDPRPPERAGLPRGGRPGLRRGRQPAGPPVPPRPRAGPDRPLHRGGAEVPLRGPGPSVALVC